METPMHLNHINLPVPDVAATAAFLRRFFGMTDIGLKETRVMALLTDGRGMVLNLSNFARTDETTYPDFFHIGFSRDSREAVDVVHRDLAEAGFHADPPRSFHGSWTFYVTAPGGFVVEVQHYEGPRAGTAKPAAAVA
jgi:lactoylglutathione lyase